MKSLYISKHFILYCRIFLAFFILFAGFQFLNHRSFISWGNIPHFLSLLQCPYELSSHKGLSFSSYNHECMAVVDGALVLKPNQKLEMLKTITCNPPYRSFVRIIKKHRNAFRIDFANSDGKNYFLKLDEFFPRESGVFLESATVPIQLLDLSGIIKNSEDSSLLEVMIECQKDSFSVTFGSDSFGLKAPKPIHQALLTIISLPSSFQFYTNSYGTFIDRIEVRETRKDGTSETIAQEDFCTVPVFFNLPLLLDIHEDSKMYMFVSFLLLVVTGFLFDWLLALMLRAGGPASISMSSLFFVLLPFQGVILFILRSSLALPFICVLYSILMLIIAKLILIMRYGRVVKPVQMIGSDQLFQHVLLALGIAVYGIEISQIWGELIEKYYLSQYAAILFVITPPLILFMGLLTTLAYPSVLWFTSVTQFYTVFFLQIFFNFQKYTPFFIISLIPFVISSCVHAVKFPRRGIYISQVYLAVLLLTILGFTEVFLRGVPTLNDDTLNPKTYIDHMWRNPERFTTLFKNHVQQNELEFAGRIHKTRKSPNVIRIICMGSSSTEGGTTSDWRSKSYPAQLEKILMERSPQKVEVINGGISGAPFFMLRTYLDEVFLPMDPDLVILYFGINSDNLESRFVYDRMKREIDEAPFIQTAEELWAALNLKWNPPWMIQGFLRLARVRTFMAVVLATNRLRNVSLPIPLVGSGRECPLTESSIEEFVDICIKQGIIIVLIPEVTLYDVHQGVVSYTYFSMYKNIADRKEGRNVYYLNVFNRFTPDIADSYLIDNVHMNDEGYRFLSEQIAEFLLEEGIIAPN